MRETLDLLGLLRLTSLGAALPTAGPNPTPLTSVIPPDDVEDHRSFFCERYDACLDEACNLRWTSWSCARCGLFRPIRPSRNLSVAAPALRLVVLC